MIISVRRKPILDTKRNATFDEVIMRYVKYFYIKAKCISISLEPFLHLAYTPNAVYFAISMTHTHKATAFRLAAVFYNGIQLTFELEAILRVSTIINSIFPHLLLRRSKN